MDNKYRRNYKIISPIIKMLRLLIFCNYLILLVEVIINVIMKESIDITMFYYNYANVFYINKILAIILTIVYFVCTSITPYAKKASLYSCEKDEENIVIKYKEKQLSIKYKKENEEIIISDENLGERLTEYDDGTKIKYFDKFRITNYINLLDVTKVHQKI